MTRTNQIFIDMSEILSLRLICPVCADSTRITLQNFNGLHLKCHSCGATWFENVAVPDFKLIHEFLKDFAALWKYKSSTSPRVEFEIKASDQLSPAAVPSSVYTS